MAGEDKIIDRIRRRLPSLARGALRLGIGDDAAVLRLSHGHEWVVTCDQFLENVHFLADVYPPEAVGYKALARATSDLAAMGARPRVFLLSLMLPASRTGVWLDRVAAGMAQAARQLGLTLAGGDTARSPDMHAMAAFGLSIMGDIETGRAVRRDGARPGDAIFITGVPGAAELGLTLLLHSAKTGSAIPKRWRPLLVPQFYPQPCIELGRWLARQQLPSAMMDVSDGLSTDLLRLCRASGLGARIEEKTIPSVGVPRDLPANAAGQRLDALKLALDGGEDYGLLFTVPRRRAARIPSVFRGVRITRIGEIMPQRRVTVVSEGGREWRLERGGWDHFKVKSHD